MGYVIPLLLLFLVFEIIASVLTFRWDNNRQHRYISQTTRNFAPIRNPPMSAISGVATVSASDIGNREEAIPTPLPVTPVKKNFSPTPPPLTKETTDYAYSGQNMINALNTYRKKNNVNISLNPDQKLTKYAQIRANYLKSTGKLDDHISFEKYLKGSAFKDLGFNSLGEIQSEGYHLSEGELIERIFAKSQVHNQIQLNPKWSHVGVGISGSYVNIVFGG